MKVHIGFVGYGLMGKVHSMCVDMQKRMFQPYLGRNYAIVTKQDLQQGLFEVSYSTLNEMLLDDKVDLVDIDTPNAIHYEQAKAALLANKHVYLEKPMCLNAQQAYELLQLSKGKVNQVALVYRFCNAVALSKELFEKGVIGDCLHFNIRLYHDSFLNMNRKKGWREQSELSGGGVMVDLGIHCFDFTRFILGEVDQIACFNFIDDQYAMLNLKMKNRSVGVIEVSKLSCTPYSDCRCEIYGSKGSICFDASDLNQVQVTLYENHQTTIYRNYGESEYSRYLQQIHSCFPLGKDIEPHVVSMYSVLKAIEDGKSVEGVPTFLQAYKSQVVLDAGLASMKSGKWEKIKDFEITSTNHDIINFIF